MAELLGLPYSPWSEKARWALELRRVPYVSKTYQPLLGEPALRAKLGRWSGVVTVPVLFDGGRVIPDSEDIARWGNERGDGPDLFPKAHDAEIRSLVVLSEEGLSAGRALSLWRVLKDRDALLEMVPRPLRPLGPVAAAIAAGGIRRTLRKYGGSAIAAEQHEHTLGRVLDELRKMIARGKGKPQVLLGDAITFADIAMAQVLAFVRPPESGLRIGAASRRSFTDPTFGERYSDVLEWRDALYERYRSS